MLSNGCICSGDAWREAETIINGDSISIKGGSISKAAGHESGNISAIAYLVLFGGTDFLRDNIQFTSQHFLKLLNGGNTYERN